MQHDTEPAQRRDLLSIYRSRKTGFISDKWESYLSYYESHLRHLRDQPLSLLEIGVQNGGSLAIWADYFSNASVVVGCDVDPRCGTLAFEDPRIRVVIGDASAPGTVEKIQDISDRFDIIIDDGSHRSSDIIKSFARYFPRLADDGIYVVEDLHCSYRKSHQGGIEAPFSSMSFFKRLSDFVNREHWGAPVADPDMLGYFSDAYGVDFSSATLDQIVEIRFRNSLCLIVKGKTGDNALGPRVVSGDTGPIEPVLLGLNRQLPVATDETANPFGPLSPRYEAIVQRHSGG